MPPPLGCEFLRGWWREGRRGFPRERQNCCHRERGERRSDQPEFFWQICYLRLISLLSWATASHSLPASRAGTETGSLSSAPNKRETNKVTFSHLTFMSDGEGAGDASRARSQFWGGASGELLGSGGLGNPCSCVGEEAQKAAPCKSKVPGHSPGCPIAQKLIEGINPSGLA